MAGGIARLNKLSGDFRREFLSDEQRSEIDQALAQSQVDAFVEEFDEAVVATREGFTDYVLSLDLTTEAGQKAYVAALEVAGSLDTLFDASEAAAMATDALNEEMDTSGLIIDNLRDHLADAADSAADLGDEVDDLDKKVGDAVSGIRASSSGLDANAQRNLGVQRFNNLVLTGDLFGTSVTESSRLDVARLRREIEEAERRKSEARLQFGAGSLQFRDTSRIENSFIGQAERQLRAEIVTLEAIANLEKQFSGFGEERFLLMQEFQPLFDGTMLSELERTTGFEEFRKRWAEIIEGAADAVLAPLEEIDDRASDIAGYLNSVLLGDSSPLSSADQLDLAESNFFDLVSRARAGEDISSSDLTGAHQALLGEIRGEFGVGPEAVERFNLATDALAQVGSMIAESNDQRVLLEQLEELRNLVEEMRNLTNAVTAGGSQRAI